MDYTANYRGCTFFKKSVNKTSTMVPSIKVTEYHSHSNTKTYAKATMNQNESKHIHGIYLQYLFQFISNLNVLLRPLIIFNYNSIFSVLNALIFKNTIKIILSVQISLYITYLIFLYQIFN